MSILINSLSLENEEIRKLFKKNKFMFKTIEQEKKDFEKQYLGKDLTRDLEYLFYEKAIEDGGVDFLCDEMKNISREIIKHIKTM